MTPITLMELVNRYVSDPTLKDQIPEFDFIWSVGQSIKERGCYCGANQKVNAIAAQYETTIQNLSPELVAKVAAVLKREEVCFGFMRNNKFETKCY